MTAKHDAADVGVRDAKSEDLDSLVAGNAAMALESEGRALDGGALRAGVRRALLDEARGRYFVAEIAGQPAGQMMITREWSDWRDGWFWWIQSVYVWPAFRRRGVYRALHKYVEQAARAAEDVCGLRLYVEAENETAQRTYESLGMTRTRYHLYEVDWRA